MSLHSNIITGEGMNNDFISGVLFGITTVAGLAFIFGFVCAWWKDIKEKK
jgi:hypothetical protein